MGGREGEKGAKEEKENEKEEGKEEERGDGKIKKKGKGNKMVIDRDSSDAHGKEEKRTRTEKEDARHLIEFAQQRAGEAPDCKRTK